MDRWLSYTKENQIQSASSVTKKSIEGLLNLKEVREKPIAGRLAMVSLVEKKSLVLYVIN
jgi:hypothetical protein